MVEIKQFNFKEFTIIAPSKHGTRWLTEKADSSIINTSTYDVNWNNKLYNSLIKENKVVLPKPYFIYRNPYDWFVSSIKTGINSSFIEKPINMNNYTIDTLNTLMCHNNHFYEFYWETLYNTFSNYEYNNIGIISLDELKPFLENKLNNSFVFNKKNYDFSSFFEKKSLLGKSNEFVDIILECKTKNEKLWNEYMERINIETYFLNKFITKFKNN